MPSYVCTVFPSMKTSRFHCKTPWVHVGKYFESLLLGCGHKVVEEESGQGLLHQLAVRGMEEKGIEVGEAHRDGGSAGFTARLAALEAEGFLTVAGVTRVQGLGFSS